MTYVHTVGDFDSHELKRGQLYLELDESPYQHIMTVVHFSEMCRGCIQNSSDKGQSQFLARYKSFKRNELLQAMSVTHQELFQNLPELVPCVGCRQSAERLYDQLASSQHLALCPLRVDSDKTLSLESEVIFDAAVLRKLLSCGSRLNDLVQTIPKSRKNKRCHLHSMDNHKPKFNESWRECWSQMSCECRKEMLIIDGEALLETVEAYLRKHKFCPECKGRVLKAYDIVVGDLDGKGEEHFNAKLYTAIKACVNKNGTHHIHITPNKPYLSKIIAKAEPDVMGNRRERHAKTLDVAQDEILTCIGIQLYERFQKFWHKLKVEEQTGQIVMCLGLRSLNNKFQLALESKQGISDFELTCEQLSKEEQAKAARQEQKRMKKKQKRKDRKEFLDMERQKQEQSTRTCSSPSSVVQSTRTCSTSSSVVQSTRTCSTSSSVLQTEDKSGSPSPPLVIPQSGTCKTSMSDLCDFNEPLERVEDCTADNSGSLDGGYSSGAERDADSCYSSLTDTCSLHGSLGGEDRSSLDGDSCSASLSCRHTDSKSRALDSGPGKPAPSRSRSCEESCDKQTAGACDAHWSTLSSMLEGDVGDSHGRGEAKEGLIPREAIRSYMNNKSELMKQRQMLRQRLQQRFNNFLSK